MFWNELVDPDRVREAVADGLLTARRWDGVTVYNYTPAAQYGNVWTRETLACRGLTVDCDGRVLARPFPKFFHPAEPHAPPLPPGEVPLVVNDKMDGSLGIGYHHPGRGRRIATRGSARSPQADEATRIWREKYRDVSFGEHVTPLFEIVYPDNRIVVDYGPMRDLVLLAVLNVRTGADLPLEQFDWPGPVARTHRFESFEHLGAHMNRDRPEDAPGEGYVARFDLGPDRPHLRYKLKWVEYVTMHRIRFGLTGRNVWETLAAADCARRGVPPRTAAARLRMSPDDYRVLSDPDTDLRATLPEEFHDWYDRTARQITDNFRTQKRRHERLTARAVADGATGRVLADRIKHLADRHGANRAILFALAKDQPTARPMLWSTVKPAEDNHPAYPTQGG